jgi:general secretion pathway protein K
MADISELMLVEKVDQEIFEKLKPHITVLPTPTTLNINTMSATVFESLGESLDVNKFIEERESDPYDSVEEFVERLKIPVNIEGLSVDTRFFRTHGQVVQGEQTLNMTSLVYRDDKGKTLVINRTLGLF